jgi:hypothetical protein
MNILQLLTAVEEHSFSGYPLTIKVDEKYDPSKEFDLVGSDLDFIELLKLFPNHNFELVDKAFDNVYAGDLLTKVTESNFYFSMDYQGRNKSRFKDTTIYLNGTQQDFQTIKNYFNLC